MAPAGSREVTVPPWLADEMVGRLARYLRFVGCDTVYARGMSDPEIVALATREDRVVLTRDRTLARRAPRALLLTSSSLREQWRAVRAAFPEVPAHVAFERCTECNGLLRLADLPPAADRGPGVPWDRVRAGMPLYRCGSCGHYYWEGSHTAEIRARLAAWSREGAP